MHHPSLGIFALVALALGALTASDACGQGAKQVWKVGILWHAAGPEEEAVMFRPFIEGMRELGYIEGHNLLLDQTYVDEHYERFQARAQELVDRKVDLILASVPAAAAAARRVTQTIPIVFATSGDPVKLGLVESLSRPGGTLTGLSTFYPELSTKHMEILRDLVPGLARVAILWNSTNEDAVVALKEAERAAQRLKLHVVPVGVKSPDEFADAFTAMTKAEVGGLIVLGDAMLRVNRKAIVALAASSRLPAVYGPRDYAEEGGLLAYGINIPMNFRRAATFVDKIFKGANPADLPVEQPMKFTFVINLKTAQELSLAVPPMLLFQADEVIK
jgi:putative ABC transport system substrate-binding protein